MTLCGVTVFSWIPIRSFQQWHIQIQKKEKVLWYVILVIELHCLKKVSTF